MTRNLTALVLTAAAFALVAAGCGSSDSSSTGGESSSAGAYGGGGATTQPASTQSSEGGAATIKVAPVPKLGKVIVNSGGFTLYDFHKDKGTTSSCYGGCESLWPPLTTTGKPQGEGVSASMLGTTKRKDGTTQVTFAGHPLYTYTADSKPGEVNGNDFSSFGAQWYALLPSGEEAEG